MSKSFNELKDLLNYATPEEKQIMLNDYPELKYDYNEVQDILNYATPEERAHFENKYHDLKPEAGYGEVLFNTPAGALAQTGQSTGGIIRAAEELLGTGTKLGESIADESLMAAGQLAEEMNLQPDTWKNTIYGGVTSAAQQLPMIAATALQPELAPLTLATMGAISGGQRYDEARRENYTPGQALLQGAAYGAAEAAGEYIPLGTLLDKTGITPAAMATKLIKYIAEEEGSELGTEVMQWATDKLAKDITANKDANYQDLMPRLIETAKATLVSAPILGGAGTLANAHLQNRELPNSIQPESIPGNEELKQLGDNLNTIETMTPEQEAELVKQALSENQQEQAQPIEPEPIQQPEVPETDSQAINNISELNNEAQANTQELKQDADEAINILQNAQEPQQAPQPIIEQTNTPLATEPPASVPENNENIQPVTQELPVNNINIHDDIQYKRNVDKNKVTNKLKGRVYNPQLAGAIDVFVNPEDGKTYVWNGHHRLQLAKDNGIENVKVINSQFNNPQEAKEAGLLKNLAEENGEPLDYRNFFKQKSIENKQQAIDFLKNKGIDVNKGLAEKGFALSQLSDYLTNEYEKGKLPENLATEIGKQLPNEADQASLYNHLKKIYFDNDKTITTNKLKDLIEFAKSAPKQSGEMDLFGNTDEINRLDIKSNISEFLLKQIKNTKNLYKKLSDENLAEAAAKIGGMIDTTKATPEQQREALAEFNFKRRMFAAGDPISAALNEATQQIIDGQPEGKVKANTYMTIKNILEENNDVENSNQAIGGINEGQGGIGQNQQGIGEQQQSGNAPTESVARNTEVEQKVYKIEQIKNVQDLINNQRNIADTSLTSVIDDKTAAVNYKGKDYTVTETPAGLKFDEIFQTQPKAKQEGLFEEDKADIEREQEAAQNTDDLFGDKNQQDEKIKIQLQPANYVQREITKIIPLEEPKPQQGFGKGLYKVEAEGNVIHGVRNIDQLIELLKSNNSNDISVSTSQKSNAINRNIIVKSKIPKTEGLYAPYDADAGKNYGYDELRINPQIFKDNIEKIYLDKKTYDELSSEEPLEHETKDDAQNRWNFWEDNYDLFEVTENPSETIFREKSNPIKSQAEIDQMFGQGEYAKDKTLTGLIYNHIKDGQDFQNKNELKNFAKENGHDITDLRKLDESYEAAKVRQAQEVYTENKNDDEILLDKFDEFTKKQLKNNRRSDTVNDLQQFSTPVNIAALTNLILDKFGAKMVLEPTAGNGGLLLNSERGAIVNELDKTRFENVKTLPNVKQAFNENALESGYDKVIEASKNNGVDAVVANPPFGIGKTQSGEPREFRIIKDALEKTGVEKGVFIIGDAHPFTERPNANNSHLTRIGGKVFEANNKGRIAEYTITGKREVGNSLVYTLKNNRTGEETKVLKEVLQGTRANGNRFFIDTPISNKMADFFEWLYSNYNVKLNEPVQGSEYKTGGTEYPTRIIAVDGKNNGNGPAFNIANIERQNKTVKEIYNKFKEGVVNDNGSREQLDGRTERQPAVRVSGRNDNVLGRSENNVTPVNSPIVDGSDTVKPEQTDTGKLSKPMASESSLPSNERTESERNDTQRNDEPVSGQVTNDGTRNTNDNSTADSGRVNDEPRTPKRNDESVDAVLDNGASRTDNPIPDGTPAGRTGSGTRQVNGEVGGSNEQRTDSRRDRHDNPDEAIQQLESNIIDYKPHSQNTVYGGLKVPANIANETDDAITRLNNKLKKQGHTFTSYVATKVGISESALTRSDKPVLTAEQVESVALTINNIENGEQTIIGHDTGTGKGRIGACVLSYAVKTLKKTPVFFTLSPGLGTDILRDLMDVHDFGAPGAKVEDFLKQFNILSINVLTNSAAGEERSKLLVYNPLDRSQALATPQKISPKNLTADNLKAVIQKGNYNIIFSTYSQFANDFQKEGARYDAIMPFIENGILVLDEVHKAAGVMDDNTADVVEGNTGPWRRTKKGNEVKATTTSNTFLNMAPFIAKAKAPVLLSATFSKRANTLPIFLWRDRAKYNIEDLHQTIQSLSTGGATSLEYVTRALTQEGKYLRMEKDYEGVQVFSEDIKYDNPTKVNNVIDTVAKVFQTITRLNADLKEAMPQTRKAGALNLENSGFSSVLHNYLGQVLFAVRTDAVGKKVADLIKQGKKVVLGFENTMESIVTELYGEPKDEKLDNDLSHIFLNVLNKHVLTREISENEEETDLNGKTKVKKGRRTKVQIGHAYVDDNGDIEIELDRRGSTPAIQEMKKEILDRELRTDEDGTTVTVARTLLELNDFLKNKKMGYSISPIDAMKRAIAKYMGDGYSINRIGEFTGREFEIDADNVYKKKKAESSNSIINKFNEGTKDNPLGAAAAYDVVFLNKKGSTGISLHNDPRFGTAVFGPKGKERVMIIAQPLADPNDMMQLLGRIHRYGQLTPPAFYLLNTGLPGETRANSSFLSKLKSLNASVSADRAGGQFDFKGADVFNIVGDQVMLEFLGENPEYARYMGFTVEENEAQGETTIKEDEENLCSRTFGKIATLTRKQQEDFLTDFMTKYNNVIDNLNAFGKNPLASTITKLDAKLLHKEVVLKATSDNPFEAGVDRYIIEGNNLLKPVQIAELEKEAARNKKEAAEILPKIIEKAQQSLAFLKHKADIIADPETSRRKLMLYEKNKEKLNDTTSQVEFLINNIGKMVSMATEEGPAKGILVDVHFTPATHTPYAKDAYEKPLTFKPGNVKIRIYENNIGEKTFMLKNVSKDITGENNYRLKQEHENWDKNIDKNQREVRDFYTGNMLKLKEVFGENQPGGIITKINMDNGDIIPGFLINKESTTINSENWQDKIKEKPLGNIGDGDNYYFKKHNVSGSAKRTYGDDYKSRNNSETPYEIKAGKYLAGLNRLEIVRIAEALAAIPEIRKRLKPGVLGMFNDKTGKIKINAAELKNSDIDEITKIIAHEIGHLIDWKEGKIPETLTRGNILGRIGALGHFMKSTLNIDPMGQPPYLSTKQRQKIYRETWKKVLNSAEYYESDMDPKIFRAAYAEEIAKYITDNNLIHKEIIIGELLNLAQHYANISNEDINNDFSMFEYYSNPAELYANAMGALLTNPSMLGDIAPTAANMIYNHMKNKPATLKLYNYFQNKINSGDRYKENLNYLRQRMTNADVKQSEEMAKRSEKQGFDDWLMTTFTDRLYPVLKYASIAPGSESSFEIFNKAQKLRSVTDICEAYLKSFAPKIAKLIKDNKIDLTDLGLRAFFTRVVEERSQEGIIDITDEQLAQELNDELESQYSTEQVAAMDKIFKILRSARQSLIDKLTDLGIYGEKLIEKLQDNKNYFTFDIVEHYDKAFGQGNAVSGRIQKQIGTLKATANPFISTILKDIALTRMAIEMDFTKSALKFLGEKGITIQKAQTVSTERGPKNLKPKATTNLGLVEILEGGKLKGYYVPKDIAETLNNPSIEISVGLQYLSALNHIPRTLFTSASIGFTVSNAIRDSIGSFLKLPHTLSNFGTFSKLYLREFKNALLNTQSEEKVNNLLSKGIIYGDRPMNFQPDPEITPWENILRKYGLSQTTTDFNETTASKWARFLNTLMGTVEYLANPIINFSGRIEKASKIAGYDYLQAIKDKYGISENEIDFMAAELAGTPNAKRKGTFTPYMNNLLLFSNVMLQGYKAHATAYKMNKTEYLAKLATVSAAPVLLMALCATGDDKDWWEKVSPYHKQNYNIIPLYWLGGKQYDKNGKALYLTLPKEELSRAIGSTFWQAINPQNGSLRETLTSMFNVWGGEIPKTAPAITAAVDTLAYARGFNPYDSFRQQYVINQRTFDRQDLETDKAFATYILNLFGMNTLYKIDTTAKKNEQPKDTVDSLSGSGLQSAYGLNVAGRFLKASDAGERSAINDLKKDVKSEQARELDLVDSALNKMYGDNKNAKITPEETAAMRKHPDYRKKQIEKYRNPDRASIKEAPKAIRQEVKKILNF